MRTRREYRLALPARPPQRRAGACVGLKLRRPAQQQAKALGGMLLDAYRGTMDDEGEDLAQAVAEVELFFKGDRGAPLVGESVVGWRGDQPVAACFTALWAHRGCPYIVFVATRSDSKRAGVGRLVLGEAVRRLSDAGHREVRAVITEGNEASQALFRSLGFEDLGRLERPEAGTTRRQ